jgi:prophage antirepressor-like protein
MSNLMILNFHGAAVRTVTIAGEPWWVAKDVCAILGLTDANKATKRLDADEKGTNPIPTPGGDQAMTVVSEAGLYRLVVRSNKPEAKAFLRWVTHDVLPTIRQTGAYVTPAAAQSLSAELAPAMAIIAQAIQALTGKSEYVTRVATEAAEMATSAQRGVSEATARLDAMQAILDDRDKDQVQALRHAVDSVKAQVFKEMIARGVGVAKVAHDFWTNVKTRAGISSVKVESLSVSSAQKLYAETLSQARIWGISVAAPLPIDFASGA